MQSCVPSSFFRRLVIPAINLNAAIFQTLEFVIWSVIWMPGREALVASRAVKHYHARQYRVHGKCCPERTLLKRHIVLDFAKLEMLQRHDDDGAVEITCTRCQIGRAKLSKIQLRLRPLRIY